MGHADLGACDTRVPAVRQNRQNFAEAKVLELKQNRGLNLPASPLISPNICMIP